MTLGEFVKAYRTDHELSTRDFAALSGLTAGYISMLECNKNPQTGKPISPRAETCQKIARATGLTFEELFMAVEDKIEIRTDCRKNLSEEEVEIVEAYGKASDRDKRIVRTVLEPYFPKGG